MSIKSREDLLNKQAEVNEQIKSYTCRVLVCSGTGCIASGAQKIYAPSSYDFVFCGFKLGSYTL